MTKTSRFFRDGIPIYLLLQFTLDIFPVHPFVWTLSSPAAMQLVHNGFGRDGDNGEHRVEVGRRRCLESRMRNLNFPVSRWSRE